MKVGAFNVKNCYYKIFVVLFGQERSLVKVRCTDILQLYPYLITNIKTLKEQLQCTHKISGDGDAICGLFRWK